MQLLVFFQAENVPLESEPILIEEKYRAYLTKKFAGYEFSPEEIGQIAAKLSPDVFATIDIPLEGAVVLVNAGTELKTTYSCAGHREGEDGYKSAYFGITYPEALTDAVLDKLDILEQQGEDDEKIQLNSRGGKTTVHYMQSVPDQWIADNGKRTPVEIFEYSKQELARKLGPEILAAKDERELVAIARDLQRKYIEENPQSATTPYGANSVLLEPFHKASL